MTRCRDARLQNAAGAYACQLTEAQEGRVGFVNWHLDDVVEAIRTAGAPAYAERLHRRYCDFWLVDGEIEQALDALRSGKKARRKAVEQPVTKTPAPPAASRRKAPAEPASK